MSRLRLSAGFLARLVLFFSLLAVYLRTLAPGLTWANGGSDGGDLIAAAATGGVAHPTGYPLYLLLAELFQLLPVGPLAFRTNLMSALFAALAAVLVYELVLHSQPTRALSPAWPAALAAGYIFGLAPLVWSQAVITEVYTLQAFLLALILTLYTRAPAASSPHSKRLDLLRGLALGAVMGNHVTTILLVPAALVLGSISRPAQPQGRDGFPASAFASPRFDWHAFLRQGAMFGVGLSIYVILPLRALAQSPINWGNPVTPARLWWLVSGQLYQSYYLQFIPSQLQEHIQAAAALLLAQLGIAGLALSVIGLLVFGRVSPLYVLTAWIAVAHVVFAALYGSADWYLYLIPVVLSFAIWAGLGIASLTDRFSQHVSRNGASRNRSYLRIALGVLVTLHFLLRAVDDVGQIDASADLRAEAFGGEVLSGVPEDAIVFAEGDPAVFTLWYFHFALGERPDVAVLAEDLLHFDWYQETLRSTYPSLVIPGPFPWPETIAATNPSRAVCEVRYANQTELFCTDP
ncbi:MAG TPA: DUF2723 domain-containing protein [Anaerolineales bacterium]|nr:DUF2723 domain-containing protein [Anaerolineales bacterium]